MKKAFLFVFFLLASSYSFPQYSQETRQMLSKVKEASYYDSVRLFTSGEQLEAKLKAEKNKSALPELHIYYGNYFFYVRNLEKARKYFEESLAEAQQYGNRQSEILARVRLAYIEFETGNREKAAGDMDELLLLAKKEGDHENTAEVLNILGIIKETKNQIQDAARLYLEGINLSDIHQLNYYSGVFRNNLGLIKYYSGRSKEALQDYENALVFAGKENNKRLASHIEMNMCVVFVNQKEFEKAAKLFAEVTDYSRKNNLPQELAGVYINLGSSFSRAGLPETAMKYIDSAIAVLKKHNLSAELTKAYLGKCDAFIALKKNADARAALEEVKKLTDKTKNLEDISTYYLMQYRINAGNKNDKEALQSYLQYSRLKDSLSTIMSGKIIEELQLKYDVQKKEIELEKERSKTILLEKSNQEERFMKWLAVLIGCGVLVLVVSFSLILYSKKVREKQQQFSRQLIQQIEEERHRIARDLHDDIGQSLSIIKSKVSGSTDPALNADRKLEHELSRVIEQTRQISRNLYPSYLEKIGLVRAAAALAEQIQAATNIECSCEVSDKADSLPIDVRTHLYRIIQECTNNTIKHAGASALKIFLEEKNGEFVLDYKDNGKGLPPKKNAGIGLQSIEERARMIGGYVTLVEKTDKGFELILKFKAT